MADFMDSWPNTPCREEMCWVSGISVCCASYQALFPAVVIL